MNDRYAFVLDGNKGVIVAEDFDPTTEQPIVRYLAPQTIRDLHCNQIIPIIDAIGNERRSPLGAAWLSSPKRRTLRGGVVFDPTDQVSRADYYNLWSGLAPIALRQQAAGGGTWELMKTHIRDLICSGNADIFRYVLGWLAMGIQHPERPAGTALVLRGEEGVGKGAFVRPYGRLFGRHFIHLSDPNHLTGTFNGHWEGQVVVFADEAVGTGDKKAASKLKALITEPTLQIEAKFRTPYTASNCTHLIMASNEKWVVPAGKDARRYCVLDVSNARRNDRQYFEALQAELDSGGYGAMLTDLQGYDLSSFDAFDIPQTAALLDQKIQSLAPVWSWWYGRLREGRILQSDEGWEVVVSRAQLRNEYFGIGFAKNAIAAGTELQAALSEILPDGFPRNGRRLGGDRKYEFPPLEICRAYFDHQIGQLVTWDA